MIITYISFIQKYIQQKQYNSLNQTRNPQPKPNKPNLNKKHQHINKKMNKKSLPPNFQSLSPNPEPNTYGRLYLQVSNFRWRGEEHPTTTSTSNSPIQYTPTFFGQQQGQSGVSQNVNNLNFNLLSFGVGNNGNGNKWGNGGRNVYGEELEGTGNGIVRYGIGEIVQYGVVTNLWMFYLYLSDMQYLPLTFHTPEPTTTKIPISLKQSTQILTPQFPARSQNRLNPQSTNIILDQKQTKERTYPVFSTRGGEQVATVCVRLWTEFDAELHWEIRELVDFGGLVVFDGISPIGSGNQLPRELPQQSSVMISSKTTNGNQQPPSTIQKKSSKPPKPHQSQPDPQPDLQQDPQYSILAQTQKNLISTHRRPYHYEQKQQQQKQKQKQQDPEKQFKIMEDDIDRLIREMQGKPYDSRRYQEGCGSNEELMNTQSRHASGINKYNPSQTHTNYTNNIVNNMQYSATDSHFHSNSGSHSLSHKLQQTQISMPRSLSRPPSYSQHSHSYSPNTHPKTHSIQKNKTIITKSPRMIKNAQYHPSLPQTTPSLHQISPSAYIQLKIHQILISLPSMSPYPHLNELLQQCYTIKIYLNNDQEQYYAGQGVREGETIVFGQSLKVRNLGQLRSVRFSAGGDYGAGWAEGVFELERLYNTRDKKGVYTVPLISDMRSNGQQSKIKIGQHKLTQVYPIHRTLRISAELIHPINLIQLFLKIRNPTPSLSITTLRYRIPLTKQTIQHLGTNHVNIFPHSCSSEGGNNVPQKIILQFWRGDQNVGQSELSLRSIRNVSYHSLEAGVEPVYLYEGKKGIKSVLEGDRVVGEYELTLCFGTVKQMQGMLLATIDQEKQAVRKKQSQKTPATFDQRLGVLITNKELVKKNQISIQVQMQQPESNRVRGSEMVKFNEPSFGDQSIISHTSHNQFIDMQASLISFTKHEPAPKHTPSKQQNTTPVPTPTTQYPTLLQTISQILTKTLTPLLPHLPTLKQQCKPHQIYNFIPQAILREILFKLGINESIIDRVFKLILFAKEGMVNVGVLYDMLVGVEVEGGVAGRLVGDRMVVVGGLRVLYGDQKVRGTVLLQDGMEFKQMSDMFKKVNIKLTLHQYQTLQKFLQNYKTPKQAQTLKQAVIDELQAQTIHQMKKCFYEQDILTQIYGDYGQYGESSHGGSVQQQSIETQRGRRKEKEMQFSEMSSLGYSEESFCGIQGKERGYFKQSEIKKTDILNFTKQKKQNPKTQENTQKPTQNQSLIPQFTQLTSIITPTLTSAPPKPTPTPPSHHPYKITFSSLDNIIQSTECVYDLSLTPSNTRFRLTIHSPSKYEKIFGCSEPSYVEERVYEREVGDVDGVVELLYGGNGSGNGGTERLLASVAFSLIKGVKSLYPFKSMSGEFCGLMNILLE